MAKYCTNCGKKLKEGEACDCKKESIMNNETTKKALDLIKGMIYTPIDTIKEFTNKSNFNLAMILVGILSVITGLFAMSLCKNGLNLAYSGIESMMSRTIEIPYMKIYITDINN